MLTDWIRNDLIKQETIYGIGVLNEPAGQFEQVWNEVMKDYYPKVYNTIRLVDPEGHMAVVIDSAFKGSDNFIDYMSKNQNVALDMHHYQGFGSYWNNMALEIPDSWKSHYKHTCRVSKWFIIFSMMGILEISKVICISLR